MTAEHRRAQKLAKVLTAKLNAALTAAHELDNYMREHNIECGPGITAFVPTCEMDEAIQNVETLAKNNGWTL